jgi:LemA protein
VTIDPANITAENLQQYSAAQGELSSALSRLLAVVENYPDLKANQNFLELQAQLEGTENRISVERKKFNDTTTEYNSYIKSFPPLLFAGIFGFKGKPYFDAEPQAQKAPKVEF